MGRGKGERGRCRRGVCIWGARRWWRYSSAPPGREEEPALLLRVALRPRGRGLRCTRSYIPRPRWGRKRVGAGRFHRAVGVPRPSGAMGCRYGWSDAALSVAQPVEPGRSYGVLPRRGKGECMPPWVARFDVFLCPSGAEGRTRTSSTGCAAPARTRAALHP